MCVNKVVDKIETGPYNERNLDILYTFNLDHVNIQGHLKKMDWKVMRKFFRSLNITDRNVLHISF